VVLAKVEPCGWTNTAGPSRSKPSNTKHSRTPLSAINSAVRTGGVAGTSDKAEKAVTRYRGENFRKARAIRRTLSRPGPTADVLELGSKLIGFWLRARIKNC